MASPMLNSGPMLARGLAQSRASEPTYAALRTALAAGTYQKGQMVFCEGRAAAGDGGQGMCQVVAIGSLTDDGVNVLTGGGLAAVFDRKGRAFEVFVNSSTGDDSGNGLDPGSPVETLSRAFDVTDALRSVTDAMTITLAAGTYEGGATLPQNWRKTGRLIVRGPDVSHPTAPTAIVDKAVTSADYGAQMTGAFAEIRDVGFTGFTAGTGVIAQDMSDLLTTNIHIDGCDVGIKASQSRLRMSGGILDGNDQNIIAISGTTFTIGYGAASTAAGTQIINASEDGILAQENSTGHVDYCIIDSNNIGLNIVGSSRVHAMSSEITDNTVAGVKLRMSSDWYDNGNTMSGNGVNVISASGSEEVGLRGDAPTPFRSGYSGTVSSHTGDTNETTLKTFSNIIRANSFTHSGRSFRIVVRGDFNGTAGTKTLKVRATNGQISGVVSGGNSAGFFVWETTFNAINGTSQRYSSMLYDQGSAQYVRGDQGDRAIDMTGAAQSITVTAQLGNAADSVDIREVEIWET